MAWAYSDFETQPTAATRLTRLRQHIGEVRASLADPDVSSDAHSVNYSTRLQYLQGLSERLSELENSAAAIPGGAIGVVRRPNHW